MLGVVLLFLLVMAALGMFGRLRMLGRPRDRRCPRCGRHRIGRGPCDCGAR